MVSVMISTETITVIAQSAPDFTGTAVGLLGVVLGSLLGLAGLRWQQDANQMHIIREKASQLLIMGGTIQQGYDIAANTTRHDDPSTNGPSAGDLARLTEKMISIVAYVELVADHKTQVVFRYFQQASEDMQRVHAILAAGGPHGEPGWSYYTNNWINARSDLVKHLTKDKAGARMARRASWQSRRAAKRFDKDQRKGVSPRP